MSPLRHPIEAIHDRWGKAGLIIAVVALVAALGGTALAAKSAFTKTQEKKIAQIAKKYAGEKGRDGAQGPQGLPGANGTNGGMGDRGENGTNGQNGKSVLIGSSAPGCGIPGGYTIEVAGESSTKKNVCNGAKGEEGEKGEKGDQGEAGPTTDVLLSGHTIRGLWGHTDSASGGAIVENIPVSFPLRVENSHGNGPTVHYIRKMPPSGSFELETSGLIGPATATADLTEGSTEVTNVNMTSGNFGLRETEINPITFEDQMVEGDGISAGTRIVAIDATEHTVTLSQPATESKSSVTLTGKPSRLIGWFSYTQEFRPAVGDLVIGPGIPVGTTVSSLAHGGEEFRHFVEVELSADPTESLPEETVTISDPPGCTGNYENPGAEPGNLCVFVESEENSVEELGNPGFEMSAFGGTNGFTVRGFGANRGQPGEPFAFRLGGSWAVTAE
jgi:hypothetical protein